MTSNEVNLEFKGITVPDSRATYYVCFSNNVKVLSGQTSAKVDFNPGEQFSTILTMKVDSAEPSSPVDCNYFDPITNKVKILWQE
ncbi:hypothetical protein [Shewanella septentrionalis]|uniref:Uncharacterized protein n=1 Tax=Shewanella septentrionalis TaxID=2952223 RepID=A0A9X3AXJ3_9GAMM|nr:hypothetical protein [Shewanella septentrionalis]MCT7944675.1 hypothetical protein [Shewanella septentrionalis]